MIGHSVSLPEFGDTRPGSLNDAGGIHAGDEWKLNLPIPVAPARTVACTRFRVSWIDTRVADPDQYFARLRLRDRDLPQAHDIWLTVAVKNHCAHVYCLLFPTRIRRLC